MARLKSGDRCTAFKKIQYRGDTLIYFLPEFTTTPHSFTSLKVCLGGLDYRQGTNEKPLKTTFLTVLPIPVSAYDC